MKCDSPGKVRFGWERSRSQRREVPLRGQRPAVYNNANLARFSHHLPAEARDRAVITALRLPAVLTGLFKYASARQAARALS